MEKKKSKGKLIALIIAIVVVVGVVTTGIVLWRIPVHYLVRQRRRHLTF